MNKFILISIVSLALFAPAVLVAEEHDSDQRRAPAKDAGMQMRMMQDNMLKLHEQMHKIMQAKDPKEREQLMQEHLKMMQEHMKMMGGTGAG
jgi:DNA-binding FadR family transcriptional regulator